MMNKRIINLLFISIACFIQLGHSLFPHTHLEEHIHNGTNHHHHESQSDENSLSVIWSHFNHNSDTFSNTQLEGVVILTKQIPSPIVVLPHVFEYTHSIGYSSKKLIVRNKEPLIFISPHLYSLQFRGPPTLLI